MVTRCVVLSAGGIVLALTLIGGGYEVKSGMSLPAFTTSGLSGVGPHSLGEGRVLRCARREEALSDAMVASSAGSTKFIRILTLKMTRRWGRLL
jgi:hypothetical protein